MSNEETTYSAFIGDSLLKSGSLTTVLAAVKLALDDQGMGTNILIFDDESCRAIDFDFRGSLDDVLAQAKPRESSRKPGRPRLGVESREVTLLPRHWSWLEDQPNGASAALRRLVEEASKKVNPDNNNLRLRKEATYNFMSAMAGNRIGFEEAARALFAGDEPTFRSIIGAWPADIEKHLLHRCAFASKDSQVV